LFKIVFVVVYNNILEAQKSAKRVQHLWCT
jgi:hypothetical protein